MASILRRGRRFLPCVLPNAGNGGATALEVVVNAFGPDPKKICKGTASVQSLFDLIMLGNGRVVR